MPLSTMSMISNQSDQLLASAVASGDANAMKMKQRGEQFPIFERLLAEWIEKASNAKDYLLYDEDLTTTSGSTEPHIIDISTHVKECIDAGLTTLAGLDNDLDSLYDDDSSSSGSYFALDLKIFQTLPNPLPTFRVH